MNINNKLPSWEESQKAIKEGMATPLHRFVFNNEPAGKAEEKQFRDELKELIEYILENMDDCSDGNDFNPKGKI